MTHNLKFVGPRGWATLILVSGAALAAPFFRAPAKIEADLNTAEESSSNSLGQWPLISERSLDPQTHQVAGLSEQDWQELGELRSKATPGQGVSKSFPSTLPRLPAWANRGARVDQLVDASLRKESLPPQASIIPSSLPPYQPWIDPRLADNHPATTSIDGSTLPNSSSTTENLLASTDPWQDKEQGWNAVGQKFPAQAVNRPRFESKPTVWPDETLRAGVRKPETAYRDALVRNDPPGGHASGGDASKVTFRSSSSPSEPGGADTSKPRIELSSSQNPQNVGSFQGRVLTPPPALPARKPAATTERTRQFIQQPKR